ncbi:hypothetical protein [Streptomyces sp. NPDC059071]|uniref:hypothetical protein n=1 Tax=unclassified Streptomyces TaxID=2593676 RepID=UPI00366A2717
MRTRLPSAPPILYGAYALAGLSLLWSGYAITDLMNSGPFGVSVAIAGDIGWITVMWAEHQRRGGRLAITAGWVIAVGVGVLLVLHGVDEKSVAQAIAGPFVVLVGKTVGSIALVVLRDPAALTPEQEDEINNVIRDGEYRARLNLAERDREQREADAIIERIKQEARITAARDRADFRITLDRLDMRAEIERKTPIAIAPITADQARDPEPITPLTAASNPQPPPAVPPPTSPNPDREQKSIADLAREQVAIHAINPPAINAICSLRPNADRDSVGAAVRRARRELDARGGYR